jgi:Trk K+ transport system NAD-binding subunit
MANQPLHTLLNPPRGTWILAGFGRFGKTVERYLEYEGIPSVIIERHPEVAPKGAIIGLGTEAVTLREAGIQKAVGIIAGTHWDAHNLSVIMNARELNPRLYLIARQNEQSNAELFKAANLDWIMEASEMIVRQILPMLTTPLLHRFLQRLRHHHEAWAAALVDRIRGICGGVTPEVWSAVISPEHTPAVHGALVQGRALCFAHLLRDPQDHTQSMPCLILMATRKGHEMLLPNENEPLAIGDHLLFCGHHQYTTRMAWTLNNANVLSYVETGEAPMNGYVWRWFHNRRG